MQGNRVDTVNQSTWQPSESLRKDSTVATPSDSLARHLGKTLRVYSYVFPPILAVVLSTFLSLMAFHYETETNLTLLKSVEEDVAEELAAHNSLEISRLFRSIHEDRKSDVILLKDGVIQGSASYATYSKDAAFYRPWTVKIGNGISISTKGLLAEVPVISPKIPDSPNYTLIMLSPLGPVLWPVFVLGLGLLGFGIIVGRIYASKMARSVAKALAPIQRLDSAIRSLPFEKAVAISDTTGVQEFDTILGAVLEAHREWDNARDLQAASRARELTAKAYEALIHDLHTPAASLRNLIQIMNSTELSEAERTEVCDHIVNLAEQILSQVKTGKAHLELDPLAFQTHDLLPLVTDAVRDGIHSSIDHKNKKVNRIVPDQRVEFNGDASLLRRAITNLLHNALDAAKSEVEVAVRVSDNSIRILVSDDGPGLSYENVSLYLQGKKKSTKADRSAYGLAATQHIIRSHGGKVIYRPSQMGGASFEIQLPQGGCK